MPESDENDFSPWSPTLWALMLAIAALLMAFALFAPTGD